jgi:hypothetical protein
MYVSHPCWGNPLPIVLLTLINLAVNSIEPLLYKKNPIDDIDNLIVSDPFCET